MTVAVALVLVGAVCSTGGGGSAIQSTTTTRPPASTTTTLDPTRAAILVAYRAGWADYIAVADTFPVQPRDPHLALNDTGKELTGERMALTQLNVLGHYDVGPTDLAPVVTSISGDSAVVTDCIFDHSYEVDARTSRLVEQPDLGHSLYRFEMTRIRVAKVASVLLDRVNEHPAQRDGPVPVIVSHDVEI